jgi:hypothetical protein
VIQVRPTVRRALATALVSLALQSACADDEGRGARDMDVTDAKATNVADAGMLADAREHAGLLDARVELDALAQELDAFVDEPTRADVGPGRDASGLPYAQAVASFRPGAHAGFGAEKFPDVILGPPQGLGTSAGSLDVLSLGVSGEIVVDVGAAEIVDGPGPDLIVFENPFWPGGQAASVFAELGEISVSEDQQTWFTFVCNTKGSSPGTYPGCAGWTPTLVYDPFVVVPLDPRLTGGDAFDLADVSVTRARYVRIRDLSTSGEGVTAGFDLDALGIIHAAH